MIDTIMKQIKTHEERILYSLADLHKEECLQYVLFHLL